MELIQYLPEGIEESNIKFLKAAFIMAQKAGDIHLKYFRKAGLEQSTKLNESDVVTVADKESEKCILDYIRTHFPEHGIISEESGKEHSEREWRWVIDPLDGTTNFSMGLPVFCVSIALEFQGEALLGVVYAPYLKECFYALKGKGSWFNGHPIHCSDKKELRKSVLATGMPYDRKEHPDNNLKEINEISLRVRGIRRMGSAAIDLCYTAAGFFDAYWELNLNRWDIAAGQLIVKEAKGEVVSLRSNRNHSILASNPYLLNDLYSFLKAK